MTWVAYGVVLQPQGRSIRRLQHENSEPDGRDRVPAALLAHADAVSDLLTKTKVMELRKVMPVFNGSETEEEKKQKREEQSRKNLKAMAKSLLFDNAELPPSCFRCSMSQTWIRTQARDHDAV